IANTDLRSHTYQVLATLKDLTGEIGNAETGQRGYLLTGKEQYLEPHRVAVKAIDVKLQQLRALTADNAKQQYRIEQLTPLLDAKIKELQQTIDLRRDKGQQAALEVVLTDKGKSTMDDIRRIAEQIEEEEKRLLEDRVEESKASAASTKSTIFYGTLTA